MSAASFNELIAGRGKVVIRADDTELVKGLNNSAKKLREFGEQIRGVGLGVAGAGASIFLPLAGASAAYGEHAENLDLASQKTGVSAEAMSALEYAAKLTRTDMDALVTSITKMDAEMGQLAMKSETARQAFGLLHLTLGDLSKLSQEDRLKIIASRLSDIHDAGEKAMVIREIFGRGGMAIEPLLANLTELTDRAKALGLIWSNEDVRAGAEFWQQTKDLWAVLTRLTEVIGSAVTPALRTMIGILIPVVNAFKEWVDRHRVLFSVAISVGTALVAMGATLVVLGTVITVAAAATTVMAGAFSLLGTVLAASAAAAWGLLAALIPVSVVGVGIGVAFQTPWLLIIAGIAAATAAVVYFGGVAGGLGNLFQSVFANIWDLMKFVGDNASNPADAIKLAFAIGAAEIYVAWNVLKDDLVSLWTGFGNFFKNLWDLIVIYASDKIASLVGKIAFLANIPGSVIPDMSGAIDALHDLSAAANADIQSRAKSGDSGDSDETKAARAALQLAHDAVAKQFSASGEQSLADKFNKLLNLFSPIAPGKMPGDPDFAAAQSRTRGTFSGSNLSQFAGSGDPAKETAKNTKESITILQRIRDNLQKIYDTREAGVFT